MSQYNYKKPENCSHFSSKLGSYQKNKFDIAMKICTKFDVAIDVGGHLGHWSHNLKSVFKTVHTFEAVPENFLCLRENVPGIHCYNVALGEADGFLDLHKKSSKNSGTWTLDGTGSNIRTVRVPMKKLDNFNLVPDFIKMDIQDGEFKALLGAYETLKNHKPVLCLESAKNRYRKDIHNFLLNLGYRMTQASGKEEYFV